MAERKATGKKLSTTNTKQEMLDAYNELLAQTEEKRAMTATPEQKVADKAVRQVVAVADALTADSIVCPGAGDSRQGGGGFCSQGYAPGPTAARRIGCPKPRESPLPDKQIKDRDHL